MFKRRWLSKQLYSSHLTRKLTYLVLMAVLMIIMATTGHVAWLSKQSLAEEVLTQSAVVVPAQCVRFTIYPEGIHPASATVHKGLVSISIEDLAGTESGMLVERLDEGKVTVIGNVRRFQNHWRGRASVELSPGIYRLRVPGRQTQEAQLRVEP